MNQRNDMAEKEDRKTGANNYRAGQGGDPFFE